MRKNALMLAVAGSLLIASGAAGALTTKTASFVVSAAVTSNCLVSAPDISFGDYDGTAAKTSTSDISVRCSSGTPFVVALSKGGGSFAQRLMSDGGSNTLQYNLFQSAGTGATIWGDASNSGTRGGTGAGMSINSALKFGVFGELLNSEFNQGAPVGSYNDTIVVSVTY